MRYLKAAFLHRIHLPLLGHVPLNAVALAAFGVAGFDHPGFWAAGAAWQALWFTATAGRVRFRRQVDATARRSAWRKIEERRLQLYNQLPAADRLRHHTLRASCPALLNPAPPMEPEPAAEILTWLHLKLLLAAHGNPPAVTPAATAAGADPDLPRLHATAGVELTDPARARLAREAVALLDPRQSPEPPPIQPLLPRIQAALLGIESELARLNGGAPHPVPSFPALHETAAALLPPATPAIAEVDRLLLEMTNHPPATLE